MIDKIGTVAFRLATLIAVHNPRYPLYIPFDMRKSEWVLSYGDVGIHEGIYIHSGVEGSIVYFEDIFELMTHLTYEEEIDWDQLEERLEIAGMAQASIVLTHQGMIDEAFGDGFCVAALPIREALEAAYYKDPERGTQEAKVKYLAKLLTVPKAAKPAGLRIVKEEEKNEDK